VGVGVRVDTKDGEHLAVAVLVDYLPQLVLL